MISKIKNWTKDHQEEVKVYSFYSACIVAVVAIGIYVNKQESKAIDQAHERGDLVVRSYSGDLVIIPKELR
jgi:hypothetical protein